MMVREATNQCDLNIFTKFRKVELGFDIDNVQVVRWVLCHYP